MPRTPSPEPERPDVPGWQLTSLLGEGGMGCVYRARRTSDGREAAVKVIRPHVAAGRFDRLVERLRREIDITKEFAHPNVVKVLDGGRIEGSSHFFLAMECLEGETLAETLQDGLVKVPLILSVLRQVIEAFAYYHPRGIVHRDLKPSNIFIERSGRVVLIDFGLVFVEDETRLTAPDEVAGSLIFMAPEQLRDQAVTPATDVFQLGASLYLALTGTSARSPEEQMLVAANVVQPPPRPPSTLRADVPEGLSELLLNCLAVDATARYSGAEELRQAFAVLESGRPVPRPAEARARTQAQAPIPVEPRPSGRRGLRWAALVALVVTATTVLLLRPPLPPRTPAARDLRADVEEFTRVLLRSPEPPSPAESRVLGDLLQAMGHVPRRGLPDRAPPEATGLLYFARSLAKAQQPARAWACYDALLERHGAVLALALLSEAQEAARAAACPEELILRLRLLCQREGTEERQAPLTLALVRAILDRRLEPDPRLSEATARLRPFVRGQGRERPSTATVDLYLEVLSALGTEEAKGECVRFMAAQSQPGPTTFERAASVLGARSRDGPAVTDLQSRQIAAWLERAVELEPDPGLRGRRAVKLAHHLLKWGRWAEGLAVVDRVDLGALAPTDRLAYYLTRADALTLASRFSEAVTLCSQALAICSVREKAEYNIEHRLVAAQALAGMLPLRSAAGTAVSTASGEPPALPWPRR